MAQLIPIFLIALFVIDSSWVKTRAEEFKRETKQILKEDKDLIDERSRVRGYLENTITELDEFDSYLSERKFLISMRRRRAIRKGRPLLSEMRSRLIDARKSYQEATEQADASRDRVAARLKKVEDETRRWMRYYRRAVILAIAGGLSGEFVALWGAVGIFSGMPVIVYTVSINMVIAGALSTIAVDRLIWDIPQKTLVIFHNVWWAVICVAVTVTWYWIWTHVQVTG